MASTLSMLTFNIMITLLTLILLQFLSPLYFPPTPKHLGEVDKIHNLTVRLSELPILLLHVLKNVKKNNEMPTNG